MKKAILLINIICMLILIGSCRYSDEIGINATDELHDISNEYKNFFPVEFGVNGEFQDLGKAYKIDLDYIAEMNEHKDAVPGKLLEITYKYAEKWEEKMNYIYNVLYEAMDKIENDTSSELYRSETFKTGKEALIISQENWQKSYDSDSELIGQWYAMENAMIDVFSSFYYNAYRTRAINLYYICNLY
jgi:uncharacterized protein YecT (DUF1311 family)